jgi:putative DNA primase/helicase
MHSTEATSQSYGCTFGMYTQTIWTDRRGLSWPELVNLLTQHAVGPKEGTCIVPATFRGDRRHKSEAAQIDVAFLDSDSGATLAEIEASVRAHGWASTISSTHSHLTRRTKVSQSNWQKFIADSPAGAETTYLVEVKDMLPRIAAGAVIAEETAEFVFLEHQPCPKFRVVIPLLQPWCAADYQTQDAANGVWKKRIEALAATLCLQHDQSCTDTSRLFYLPRHAAGSPPPEFVVVEGAPCDLFELAVHEDGLTAARLGSGTSKRRSRACPDADTHDFTDPSTGEVLNLRDWVRDCGDRFEIADALFARQPGVLTGHVADGVKVHIRCPNEDAHTDAGEDAATFVTNAGNATNHGFVVHCRHAHCTGMDRLMFVRKMLECKWLSAADLTDNTFLLGDGDKNEHPDTENVEDVEHADAKGPKLPHPFFLNANGVWYRPAPGSDKVKSPIWICAPFQVIAETADEMGGSWGLLLAWKDRDGRAHRWAMPRKLLHAAGNDIAAELEHAGLSVGTGKVPHDLLKRLLSQIKTPNRKRCVLQTGWHQTDTGIVYVLPFGETYGPGGADVILQSNHVAVPEVTLPRGTLDEWRQNIARLAVGNHRLGLYIAAAFAAPLLDVTSEQTGGLHVYGKSQSGKTTLLQSAASVWGRGDTKGQIRTWRATSNGMESVAAETCDALLPLDEIGMVDPREAGEIVYSLANESGKARAARDGSARPRRTWRLIFLSTGEVPLDVKMGERGATPMAGQEVRLANLPADAGAGLGVFQQLHGFASGDALSAHLRQAARTCYGTAARAFIEKLTQSRQENPDGLAALIQKVQQIFIRRARLPDDADGQVVSVARRFSLIAAAGELARIFGVLNWPKEEAMNAAISGLQAWISARGGTGAGEDARAVAAVRRFIEQHGESRFTEIRKASQQPKSHWDDTGEDRDLAADDETLAERLTINRVGFRRKTSERWLYLIMPESWKSEICKGLDPSRAAQALHDAGFLDKGEGQHWQKKHRVPGEQRGRYYTIKGSIITDDGSDDEQ